MKKLIGPLLGLILSVVLAGTALAEGSFTSSMYDVRKNFSSRVWVDKNLDNVGTVIKFWNCRDGAVNGSTDWVDITLWRHNFALPATHMGTKRLNCYVYDAKNWGDVAAADYQFSVYQFGPNPLGLRTCQCEGGNVLDVDPLNVGY
ncbi:MAG TPA: hypothetical protein VJ820_08705 [Propionibacteriaceae bacterium]|nr:hypothetical protein [Propionibacteriaceae bacterium]